MPTICRTAHSDTFSENKHFAKLYMNIHLCLAGHRTQNVKILYADLILAGITQFITVVLTNKIKYHEHIQSLKPLIA